MGNYWTFNSMIIVVAFCLFVTALGSDTRDSGNDDPLSVPLINDKGAPLVAMLDTNAINRKLKVYIRTLMRDMIQSSIREQMQDILKTSLEGNSTIDFIRNITRQEINDVLKEQLLEGKSTLMKDMIQISIQEQTQEIVNTSLEGNSTIDLIRSITLQEVQNLLKKQPKEDKSTRMRDMIQSSVSEQIRGIFKTSLEEKSTIDFIRIITLQEKNKVLKEQVQKGLNSPPIGKYKDCSDLNRNTNRILIDGVYKIYPRGNNPIQAYCDMTTDGGGWTVMLKRYGGTVSFKRTWLECENGFGDLDGDFWFGNKYTHMLTSVGKYELRVDMVDSKTNRKTYAVYKTFIVGDAASKYKLTVGDYSGNAGDSLRNHNNSKFTTIDQDNDRHSINCAVHQGGSWWYTSCSSCDLSRTIYKPYWTNTNNAVSKSVMMIRKI